MTRPGGNYTQPWHVMPENRVEFRVYVGWQEIGRYDTDAEAAAALRAACRKGRPFDERDLASLDKVFRSNRAAKKEL